MNPVRAVTIYVIVTDEHAEDIWVSPRNKHLHTIILITNIYRCIYVVP